MVSMKKLLEVRALSVMKSTRDLLLSSQFHNSKQTKTRLFLGLSLLGLTLRSVGQSVEHGSLSKAASALDRRGLDLSATFIDIGYYNPSAGLSAGHAINGGQLVLAAEADMRKAANIPGMTLHFEETVPALRANDDWALYIGDDTVGYEPPYFFGRGHLSLLTVEQKLFHDRVDIEGGRTNPIRYVNFPICFNQLSTCWSDVWSFDAGGFAPTYATWGGRVRVNLPGFMRQTGLVP